MIVLGTFLTMLIVFGATALACVIASLTTYENEPDPEPLKLIGGFSILMTGLSLVGSLIAGVWVVLL